MRTRSLSSVRSIPHHVEQFGALEPRRLLVVPTPIAGNQASFTDIDGDVVTVKLTGPGSLARVGVPGDANFALFGSNTTLASSLSISTKKIGAGNGRTFAQGISTGELGSLVAPGVDIGDGGLTFSGHVNSISILSIGSGNTTIGGGVGLATSITAVDGLFSADTGEPGLHVLSAPGKVLSITTRFLGARIEAGVIKSLKLIDNPTNNTAVLNTHFQLTGLPGFAQAMAGFSTSDLVLNLSIVAPGDVGAMKMGTAENVSIEADGVVKSISVLRDADELDISARAIGALTVGGTLSGSDFDLVGGAGITVAMGAIKIGQGTEVGFFAGGLRIASITAGSLFDTTIFAGSVGAISVAGSSALGRRGDAEMTITTSDTTRATTLDKLTVKGLIGGSIQLVGNCGPVSLGGIREDWVMLVGTTGLTPADVRDDGTPFTSTGLFAPSGGVIASLKIARPALNAGFDVANRNIEPFAVIAQTIASLDVFTGFARDELGTFNNHYGIATQFVGKFKRTGIFSSASGTGLNALHASTLVGTSQGFSGNVFPTCVDISLGDPNPNAFILMLTVLV